MKAILLVDQTGPNPAFSPAAAQIAAASGEEYNVPRTITYPAGTEIDHPNCWILCCKDEPTARPADEECADKVHAWLNSPTRKAQLARLKQLSQPAVLAQLPKQLRDYVEAVSAKWLKDEESPEPSDKSPETDNSTEPGTQSPIDDDTLAFFDGGTEDEQADTDAQFDTDTPDEQADTE